ncbi:MAG TPA: helix-turn-helix domain-containing protein [Nitrolancea sp.]|nr:helix-turn-helix domain-containing protein [Nitrolancea sp.]
MPKLCRVRPLTDDEAATLERLARSRTAAARLVERARSLWRSSQGWRVPAIATAAGRSPETVREWIARFNAQGLDGLADAPRTGRPPTYTAEEIGTLIATALSDPQTLGQPFGSWTCQRLATYLAEEQGIAIKRSRVQELLVREGLRWRQQERWFGATVDPAFAEKRGPSRSSTPRPRRTAS